MADKEPQHIFQELVWSSYSFRGVRMSIEETHVAAQTSREVDDAHVDRMLQEMLVDGYTEKGLGQITVAERMHNGKKRFEIADGLHRRTVGMRILASTDVSEKTKALQKQFRDLPIQIVSRNDGLEMTLEDLLFISQRMNSKSHRVLPTRPRDRVHSAISLYNAVNGRMGTAELKTAATFGMFLHSRHFHMAMKLSQAISYASVALKMMHSPLTYAAFKTFSADDEEGVAFSVLKNSVFTRATDRASLLILTCLKLRKDNPSKHLAFGQYKDLKVKDYLQNICDYSAVMRAAAEELKVDIATIHDLPDLFVRNGKQVSTTTYVYELVTMFEKGVVPRTKEAQQLRDQRFKQTIIDRLNPPTSPKLTLPSEQDDIPSPSPATPIEGLEPAPLPAITNTPPTQGPVIDDDAASDRLTKNTPADDNDSAHSIEQKLRGTAVHDGISPERDEILPNIDRASSGSADQNQHHSDEDGSSSSEDAIIPDVRDTTVEGDPKSPFQCALGEHCRLPLSKPAHKCTTCNSVAVHNLCDYPRVHHLIPVKYINNGDRDMLMVCSRKCYDGKNEGDLPSFAPPPGVSVQEAWKGDPFDPFKPSTAKSPLKSTPKKNTSRSTTAGKSPILPTPKGSKSSAAPTPSPSTPKTPAESARTPVAEKSADTPSTATVRKSPRTKRNVTSLYTPERNVKQKISRSASKKGPKTKTLKGSETNSAFPAPFSAVPHPKNEEKQQDVPPAVLEKVSTQKAARNVHLASSLLPDNHRSGFYLTVEKIQSIKDSIATAAATEPLQQEIFFERARGSIESLGYAVLDDILSQRIVKASVDVLCKSFAEMFTNQSKNSWMLIPNIGTTNVGAATSENERRYMTPCSAVTDDLENSNEPLFSDKLIVDVALAVVGHQLHLRSAISSLREYAEGSELKFQESGLRLLLTGNGTKRQASHFAFNPTTPGKLWKTNVDANPEPSYVFVATGAVGSPVLVRPRSHVYINCAPRYVSKIWHLLPPRIVWIPPFSVMVMRGDVEHAGPGWDDHALMRTMHPNDGQLSTYGQYVRIQSLAVREGAMVPEDMQCIDNSPKRYKFPHDDVQVI